LAGSPFGRLAHNVYSLFRGYLFKLFGFFEKILLSYPGEFKSLSILNSHSGKAFSRYLFKQINEKRIGWMKKNYFKLFDFFVKKGFYRAFFGAKKWFIRTATIRRVPMMVPRPPKMLAPTKTTVVMTSNSILRAMSAFAVLRLATYSAA